MVEIPNALDGFPTDPFSYGHVSNSLIIPRPPVQKSTEREDPSRANDVTLRLLPNVASPYSEGAEPQRANEGSDRNA